MPAASALAHVLLLAFLFRAPGDAPAQMEVATMTVSLYDGPAAAASAPPAPTPPAASRAPSKTTPEPVSPPPSEVEPQYIDLPLPEIDQTAERDPANDPVALSVAAASAASGPACDLTAWLQQALQSDPYVQAALPLVPRPARSVANAIMMWDGGWVDPRPPAAPPLGAIRMALVSGIRAAPAACLGELVRGPELVVLSVGLDTTVLAIGSGEWRWGDLLRNADEQLRGTPTPRAAATSMS